MKCLFLVLAIACASATDLQVEDSDWKKLEEIMSVGDSSGITAVVNTFADKCFKNIEKFCVKKGLDPMPISSIDENFLVARITLDNGTFQGISTLSRFDDALVSYKHSDRTLGIIVPVKFSNLSFVYDYKFTVTFFGPSGYVVGAVHDFKADIQLSFDFKTYHAKIEKISTVNTGNIDFTFHGQLIDGIVNIFTQFVTAVLHPMLTGIIEGVMKKVANIVVDDVNDAFDKLNPPEYWQLS